jgi:putative flippase GtrA
LTNSLCTGIIFAALLVAIQGTEWLYEPRLLPAVFFGIVSVVIPLFLMQPGMGVGFAASKTATPLKNCMRSLVTHTSFGLELFASVWVLGGLFK